MIAMQQDGFGIKDASMLCGVSVHLLRIWELRTGWPRPDRAPNGYRIYSRAMIAELERVRELVDAGHRIGEIIVDGLPRLIPLKPRKRAGGWARYAQIGLPSGADALAFAQQMTRALRSRDVAAIAYAIHSAPIMLRPADRLLAAWLPAWFGAREWERCDEPLPRDVCAIVRRVAGDAVANEVQERWATAECVAP